MKWSRLKSLVEERQAPALRRRVTLHQARYRHSQEEVGRVWIAADGKELAAFATHMGWQAIAPLTNRLMDEREAWGTAAAYAQANADAEAALRAAGTMSDAAALAELEQFLSLPIDESLASPSPLQRALAVIDGRVGKRRLRSLAAQPDPHPLVQTLLRLRCEAEGIPTDARAVQRVVRRPPDTNSG